MMSRTLPVATLLLSLTAASPVLAQGTDEQRSACSGDAFRLCASAIPNVGKISACMRAKREQLSPGCRLVMDKTDGGSRVAEAPPPRTVEKPKFAAREATSRRPASRVAQSEEPRATPRPAARETVARRQAPASPRVAQREEPRATPRTATRIASVRQTPRVASRATGPRSPYYGRNSDYAQADYWMRRVTGSGISEASTMLAGFDTLFR